MISRLPSLYQIAGVGIETEQLDRIWELFEQGTDPLRRAQGSTFTVKLPRLKSVN